MARTKSLKNQFTLNPSFFSHLLSTSPFNSLFFTTKKHPRNYHHHHHLYSSSPNPTLSLFILFTFFSISTTTLIFLNSHNPLLWSSISPSSSPLTSPPYPPMFLASLSTLVSDKTDDEPRLSTSAMVPLPPRVVAGNISQEEGEFWKQPDGEGYRPCLDFSIGYRKKSAKIAKEKQRFLVVAVSGGLNQQRNQIVDAVVIARILEAALVVPILQVDRIWGDESEFSEIFDVEYFKKTLKADVRVVSSLPSTHLVSKQSIVSNIPQDVPQLWIRTRFFKKLTEEGLLVLKGLDSKLSKNLPSDLQKLRCKVAFHALRFAAPIQELGNRITRRMWIEGPYIAIHLRLEKDVWVRTGCSTGLGPKYDLSIAKDRGSHPELLTGKSNMTQTQRKLAGQCPLNAFEVATLLKGLGAPRRARVYIAGGEPYGGKKAMKALVEEYPNIVTKEMLAKEGELRPYIKRPSVLAAIDYIVSLSSDVFLPSHGGNMGKAMEGHRAYVGHRKYIKPNKRLMVRLLEERKWIGEIEMGRLVREIHKRREGKPELRTKKRDRDVIAFPVPECMCKQ